MKTPPDQRFPFPPKPAPGPTKDQVIEDLQRQLGRAHAVIFEAKEMLSAKDMVIIEQGAELRSLRGAVLAMQAPPPPGGTVEAPPPPLTESEAPPPPPATATH